MYYISRCHLLLGLLRWLFMGLPASLVVPHPSLFSREIMSLLCANPAPSPTAPITLKIKFEVLPQQTGSARSSPHPPLPPHLLPSPAAYPAPALLAFLILKHTGHTLTSLRTFVPAIFSTCLSRLTPVCEPDLGSEIPERANPDLRLKPSLPVVIHCFVQHMLSVPSKGRDRVGLVHCGLHSA